MNVAAVKFITTLAASEAAREQIAIILRSHVMFIRFPAVILPEKNNINTFRTSQ